MTIERKHTNERMSQIVTHGDTVYLAGQVAQDAQDAAGAPTAAQMKNIFLDQCGPPQVLQELIVPIQF